MCCGCCCGWAVRVLRLCCGCVVVVRLCGCAVVVLVVLSVVLVCCGGCGCVCARFVPSCIEKRSHVYVRNAPVCSFKTPVSHKTRAFAKYTRERLNVHTGASRAVSLALPLSLSRQSFFSCLTLSSCVSVTSPLFLFFWSRNAVARTWSRQRQHM